MDNPHKRKKQPEQVRRALLDAATRLAVEGGVASVTVQAVSEAAGVTKGGFLHHFPSKQALVTAVFEELLETIDRDLDARLAADPKPYGRFSRAYVEAVFDMDPDTDGGAWAALSMSWLTDPGLRALWAGWFQARVDHHRDTDDSVALTMVRMAADGVWLADLAGVSVEDREALRERLIRATRRPAR